RHADMHRVVATLSGFTLARIDEVRPELVNRSPNNRLTLNGGLDAARTPNPPVVHETRTATPTRASTAQRTIVPHLPQGRVASRGRRRGCCVYRRFETSSREEVLSYGVYT